MTQRSNQPAVWQIPQDWRGIAMKDNIRELKENISRYEQCLAELGDPPDARGRVKLIIYQLLLDRNVQRLGDHRN